MAGAEAGSTSTPHAGAAPSRVSRRPAVGDAARLVRWALVNRPARTLRTLTCLLLTGCAAGADLGVLQQGLGQGGGASVTSHLGFGAVPDRIVVVELDARADVATSGNRVALGASVLGGLPLGPLHVLARAGVWRAVTSNTEERGAVPTFELMGFVPLRKHGAPGDLRGQSAAGIVFGVREDLDVDAYTTVFVGVRMFMVPGY